MTGSIACRTIRLADMPAPRATPITVPAARGSGAGGAGLVYPLAVGVAPHILAGLDDRTASGAGLAGRVQLVVAEVGSTLVLVRHRVFLVRAAEILQQPFLDFVASEVWRCCHAGLLRV
jgi:hypothetical protein